MRILVGVKCVMDYHVNVQIKPDGSGVETAHQKFAMNPYDEVAVEAAVRLKETGQVDEIIVLSVGSAVSENILRSALAMGADRGILIEHDAAIESLAIAKLFKLLAQQQQIDFIMMGKQAIDDDAGQTGAMTAALLGWTQATFASAIMLTEKTAIVERELDNGTEIIEVTLPTVITTDLRLNTPRFASLPQIMQAKKKIIEKYTASELGIDLTPHLEITSVREPEKRPAGVCLESVSELVDRLKNEAKVLNML